MLHQVTFLSSTHNQILEIAPQENNVVIDCSLWISEFQSFDLVVDFDIEIEWFRNHDYTWVDIKQDRIATEFSPKILKLSNGFYVQANICYGIWEVNPKNPKQLLWRFNPEYSNPLTVYEGKNNAKVTKQALSKFNFKQQPILLFSSKDALEFSRSKIPFSAVACFTDHCDFDTVHNLEIQRNFFKEKNIKVTKGFFLNHFSKREDNASAENNFAKISLWENDGHELCYHSLSQSIKNEENSFSDFKNGISPYVTTTVWIDHGFQPYNFSLFQNYNFQENEYEILLKNKGIKLLWNYIDSGSATLGIINQLNPNQFTLGTLWKGSKNESFFKVFQTMLKAIVFHFLNDDKTITQYKLTALHFKKIIYQRQLKQISSFLKNIILLSKAVSSAVFSWNSVKNTSFKLAKYTPLFFKHTIFKEEFIVFQTLEMIDFTSSLSKKNIDLLIKESGIFIAHTYFSDSISYHSGKLINNNQIDHQAAANFDYVSEKINQKQIWNPTLSQLYKYLQELDEIVFDVDKNGSIFVKNNTELVTRKIV